MTTWIALFRGINVGGRNALPMAKLKRHFESLQLKNVQSYIQSGNIVFDAADKTDHSIGKRVESLIEEQHGFRPLLMVLSRKSLLEAVEANPFPDATSDPKALHFFFLLEPPSAPNILALDAAKSATERYKLTDRVFYLHAPGGIGRSKLAANAEKYLGVAATARNYRTVEKLVSMVAKN